MCADTDRCAVTPFNADGFDTFSVRQLEHILVGITAAIYGFHCERLTGGSNLSAVKRCKSTAGLRFSHHLGIFFVSKTIRVSPHSFQCQFLAHKNLPKQKNKPGYAFAITGLTRHLPLTQPPFLRDGAAAHGSSDERIFGISPTKILLYTIGCEKSIIF